MLKIKAKQLKIGGKKVMNFAQEAIARHGEKIKDAVVEKTTKGERTKTTMGVNLNGGPSRTIEVV